MNSSEIEWVKIIELFAVCLGLSFLVLKGMPILGSLGDRWVHGKYNYSWGGKLRRRWRWTRLRYEWGRWCYVTNAFGETRGMWWLWEDELENRRRSLEDGQEP